MIESPCRKCLNREENKDVCLDFCQAIVKFRDGIPYTNDDRTPLDIEEYNKILKKIKLKECERSCYRYYREATNEVIKYCNNKLQGKIETKNKIVSINKIYTNNMQNMGTINSTNLQLIQTDEVVKKLTNVVIKYRNCIIMSCDKKRHAQGMCRKHYDVYRRSTW